MHPNDTTSQDVPLKHCSCCKAELPATTEYFYVDSRYKNKFSSRCKVCTLKKANEWTQANQERSNGIKERWAKNNPEKRQIAKLRYYQDNKEKHHLYYKKHLEQHRANGRASYYKDVEHSRARARMRSREWNQRNPDAARAVIQRRAARKRSLPDSYRATDWKKALAYFGGNCAVCGRSTGLWHNLSLDHWIPLSSPDCPGTIAQNCLPLCHGKDGCNQSKSNKPAADWLVSKFGKRKAAGILKRINAYFEWVKTQ